MSFLYNFARIAWIKRVMGAPFAQFRFTECHQRRPQHVAVRRVQPQQPPIEGDGGPLYRSRRVWAETPLASAETKGWLSRPYIQGKTPQALAICRHVKTPPVLQSENNFKNCLLTGNVRVTRAVQTDLQNIHCPLVSENVLFFSNFDLCKYLRGRHVC